MFVNISSPRGPLSCNLRFIEIALDVLYEVRSICAAN